MRTILSLDPSGDPRGHTGIVLLGYTETEPVTLLGAWAEPGGVDAFRDWYLRTVSQNKYVETPPAFPCEPTDQFCIDTVVVEQFVDRQIRGADRSPMLVEGVVRFLWPGVHLSPASGYKTAVPDAALKNLGLWLTGDHHNDRISAARHGVRWLKKQGHVPTIRKGFPQ